MVPKQSPELVRFGVFEVDFRAGEVRKHGRKIKLQDRPFQLLAVLLERPGQTIAREELTRRLWPEDAPIDVDNSLNMAAKKLRQALGDDAETPRFVETVPRRGYRFIGHVEAMPAAGASAQAGGAAPDVAASPAPDASPPPAANPGAHRPRRPWVPVLAGAAALSLLAIRLLQPARSPAVLRTVQLTHTGRADPHATILTDGARIYFHERSGGRFPLAQVSVEGGTPSPFPVPPDNLELLAISPNRSELMVKIAVGNEEDAPLWIVPTVAGSPRRLGDVRAHSATWSRDGRSVVYGFGEALYGVNGDGTNPRQLAATPGTPYFVHWSPPGQPAILRFTLAKKVFSIWECSPDGSGMRPFPTARPWAGATEGELGAGWTPDGKYYLLESLGERNVGVWAVREGGDLFHLFDRRPFPIYATPSDAGVVVSSADGKKLFFAGGQENRELVGFDAKRNQFLPFLSGGARRGVDFSRDGQWVAYEGIMDGLLWRSRADGSEPQPLTAPPRHIAFPKWSPDGQRIAFIAGQAGIDTKLFVVASKGGSLETVATAPYLTSEPSWSGDGQTLMFGCWPPGGWPESATVCLLDWKTRKIVRLPGTEGLLRPVWSPDGRYIAALRENGSQVVLFDMRSRQWTRLAGAGAYGIPYWTGDSRNFYFQQVLGDSDQPIFRANVATREVERTMDARQIPQSGFSGYTLTGLTPGGAPIATVLRNNGDLYALDVDLP